MSKDLFSVQPAKQAGKINNFCSDTDGAQSVQFVLTFKDESEPKVFSRPIEKTFEIAARELLHCAVSER